MMMETERQILEQEGLAKRLVGNESEPENGFYEISFLMGDEVELSLVQGDAGEWGVDLYRVGEGPMEKHIALDVAAQIIRAVSVADALNEAKR